MAIYLVTGGAGFISSNIVKYLIDKGERVRVIDNFSTGRRENIEEFKGESNFEFIEGDLRNNDVVREAIKGVVYVFQKAAVPSVQCSIEFLVKTNDANINGTLNLLMAARDEGVKKLSMQVHPPYMVQGKSYQRRKM